MERPGTRKRLEDLDKMLNADLLNLLEELSTECEEKRKSCAKLQSEVLLIQNNLAERNAARAAKISEYSEAVELVPLAEKANSAKQRIDELETRLKEAKDSEQRLHRRQELQDEIRMLQSERSRMESNYSALLENLANVKSQVECLEKAQPETSRPQTRREADERLDDLLKQYLPDRLFKTRRRDDQ